jgi:multidrug efflux system outer membrane protein
MKQILILFSIVGLLSCKSLKKLEVTKIDTIPSNYSTSNDSLSMAKIPWNKLFTDTLLLTYIDQGLEHNIDLKVLAQQIQRSSSSYEFSKKSLFPSLNLFSSGGQKKFGDYTMDWAGNKTTEITPGKIIPKHLQDYSIGLQSSWEIDVWSKLKNKKRAALYNLLSSEEGKKFVQTNLVSEIACSYYFLVFLDKKKQFIQSTIQNQEKTLDLMKIQKEVGIVNELAVKQFEAQLLNTKNLIYEIDQEIYTTENKIKLLLGVQSQKIVRNTQSIIPFNLALLHIGQPIDLLENRTDIRQAQNNLLATKADVFAAKAAFYPSLTISGNIGFQAFETRYLVNFPSSIAYSIFGNLTAPILNRNLLKLEFNHAKSNQIEALLTYEQTILNAITEVNNESTKLKNLENQLRLKNEESALLTNSIVIANELFKTGKSSYLEVLNVQTNALNTQMNVLELNYEFTRTMIELYKSLGGGWK